MSANQERDDLMTAARALQSELHELNKKVNPIINALISEGDGLMQTAFAEKDAPKAKGSIRYVPPGAVGAGTPKPKETHCSVHPHYQAKRIPRSGCKQCMDLYNERKNDAG